jgi:hypothetical protein
MEGQIPVAVSNHLSRSLSALVRPTGSALYRFAKYSLRIALRVQQYLFVSDFPRSMEPEMKESHKRSRNPAYKKYRVTNWKEYENFLRNRGSLTLWISPSAIKTWKANFSNLGFNPHGDRGQ